MTSGPLSPEDVARLHADVHAGYDLISYGEIGLPYFELRIRAQILERKELNPFAEFVSRALAAGLDQLDDIKSTLGIDDRVLEATIVDLVVKEQIRVTDNGSAHLHLTTQGQTVLAKAYEIRPRATQVNVDFDGLLQEVVQPFGEYLHPRELRRAGIREIPLPSRLQPELHRIDVRDVERALRQIAGGRDPLIDILALKSMRRYRVFRPAVGLVYRSASSPDVLVDIAVDGQRSERHALAFAEAGLTKRLGLDDDIERAEFRIAPAVGRVVAEILQDEDRNQKMRELKRAMRAGDLAASGDPDDPAVPTDESVADHAKRRAERAREIFESVEIRAVETFEHPEYLRKALVESRQRLIIISPWLRGDVIDRPFVGKLENLLHQGAEVYIGWGISKDERDEPNADPGVLRRLDEVAKRFRGLNVRRLGSTHAKVLISDDKFIIVTSFNWLSFRGDPKRTFRDERGTLITKSEYVEQQAQDWLAKFNDATP